MREDERCEAEASNAQHYEKKSREGDANKKTTMGSPAAFNFLRRSSAITYSYQVAIVPPALRDGYLRYFDNVERRFKPRVISQTFRGATVERLLHPDVFKALTEEQGRFIARYPHMDRVFDGLQHLIYHSSDGPSRISEKELLKSFEKAAAAPPEFPNAYSTAIRWNLGNGVMSSIPILQISVNVRLDPVPMMSLDK